MTSRPPSETAYFPGEFLSAADYAAEQAYQIEMQRAGGRTLNGWGLVRGLTVASAQPQGAAEVSPGLAIDSRGRLLLSPESYYVAPPTAAALAASPIQLLTVSFREASLPAVDGAIGAILDDVAIAWLGSNAVTDPSLTLVLATLTGTSLTPDGRVYAGVPAGGFEFASALTPSRASLVGWSAPPLTGLRIDTPLLTISAMPLAAQSSPQDSSLSVLQGALGVGTMSPQAYLDVLAPNVALTGSGLLTSFDTVVRGTDARLGQIIHVGDILMVTDREGQPKQSRVTGVSSDTELVTATPLNCASAPFVYEQALTVSIRDGSGLAALNVDRLANVGLGVDAPQARLHVGSATGGTDPGDVELTTNGGTLSFQGPGKVVAGDNASVIDFQTSPPPGDVTQMVFSQQGDIQWLPGLAATPPATPPVGMTLLANGNLGMGTTTPTTRLDVEGTIQLINGGLVFPDGTTQTTAETSIPIGAIIDWWQGSANQQPPANFMICAGGVVTDTASPLYGLTLPNMANKFTFGALDDTQSMVPTGSDTHQHGYRTPAHTHGFPHSHANLSGQTGQANHDDGTAGGSGNAAAGHVHQWVATVGEASTETTQNNSDAGQAATTDPASTLPPYVGLLKLMRIR